MRGLLAVAGLSSSLVAWPAQAAQGIVISNPTAIAYGVQGNMVYLRNLNSYDSTWLPCCYNYWIDVSTPGGQAMFSALLAHKLSGKSLTIWKTDPTTAGPIDILGDF
jgi:hypothetical protein